MSGYRQSGYDSNAYEQPGPPLRPFNRVQWTGFALAMAGLAINIVYLAGFFGWISPLLDTPSPALVLMLVGVVLINSRRAAAYDLAPELASARKRWLIIILALCVLILGAAAAIELTGAN